MGFGLNFAALGGIWLLFAVFCYISAALCCLLLHFCCSGCFFCARSCGCGCVCGCGCACGCNGYGCACSCDCACTCGCGAVFACCHCWGRAKRASKASERSSLVLALGFPCLPMLSLAYPCFHLSCIPLLCLLCSCLPGTCYSMLHASTALKRCRSYCCMLPPLSYVFALPVPY